MILKGPMIPADVPVHWAVYFAVRDADRAVEQVKALGGSLLMGPLDIETGRFAVVADDQGTTFNVIKMNG
jgi:hypothetical protein